MRRRRLWARNMSIFKSLMKLAHIYPFTFQILNAIYIGRQMTSLNESLADGNTMDNLQFNDGHLDTIFAFVGIALASISGKK